MLVKTKLRKNLFSKETNALINNENFASKNHIIDDKSVLLDNNVVNIDSIPDNLFFNHLMLKVNFKQLTLEEAIIARKDQLIDRKIKAETRTKINYTTDEKLKKYLEACYYEISGTEDSLLSLFSRNKRSPILFMKYPGERNSLCALDKRSMYNFHWLVFENLSSMVKIFHS